MLWLGGHQVLTGAMTVGTLVAFNRYVMLVDDPVRWLGLVVNRIARAVASGERVFDTLDTKPAIKSKRDAIKLDPLQGEVEFRMSPSPSGAQSAPRSKTFRSMCSRAR